MSQANLNSKKRRYSGESEGESTPKLLFSRKTRNWASTMRALASEVREKFPDTAECFLDLVIPPIVREQVHEAGLWCQAPLPGDTTNKSAHALVNPHVAKEAERTEDSAVRRNLSVSFIDTPASGSRPSSPTNNSVSNSGGSSSSSSILRSPGGSSLMGKFASPIKPTGVGFTYGCDLEKNQRDVERVEKEIADMEGTIKRNREELRKFEEDWISADASTRVPDVIHKLDVGDKLADRDMLMSKLAGLRKRLEQLHEDGRKSEQEQKKFKADNYKQFMSKVGPMIGFLQSHCDKDLQQRAISCQDYLEAVSSKDIIKAIFISKIYCLDADTDNVREQNMSRLNWLTTIVMQANQTFGSFAQTYVEKYQEYRDLGGDHMEADFVNAVCRAVRGDHFTPVIHNWVMGIDKPTTVATALELLRVVDSRFNTLVDPAPPAKRALLAGGVASPPRGNVGGSQSSGMGSSSGSRTANYSEKSCWDFAKGNCRFGDKCKYKHIASADASSSSSSSGGAGKAASSAVGSKKPGDDKYLKPCASMMQKGYCKRGESCQRAKCHAVSKAIYEKYYQKKTGKEGMDDDDVDQVLG